MRRPARFTPARWLALSLGVLVVAALARARDGGWRRLGVVATRATRLADRVDPRPAARAAAPSRALVNQETGVRGFLLGARGSSSSPYRTGARRRARGLRDLDAPRPRSPAPARGATLAAVRAADRPLARRVRASRRSARVRADGADARPSRTSTAGKAPLRRACARRSAACDGPSPSRGRTHGGDLDNAATTLNRALVFAAIVLLGAVVAVAVVARNVIARPLGRLADQVRARSRAASFGRPSSPAARATWPRSATTSRRCACGSWRSSRPSSDAQEELEAQARRAQRGPTPSSSSSPTSPRTTSRSRCARSRASASCSSAATPASSTSAPTSTSRSPSTARSGCRS